MTNLENQKSVDSPESIDLKENLTGIEEDFNELETTVRATDLKNSVEKGGDPLPGKFLKCRESKDGNFIIYKYKLKNGGTPEGIREQAVKQAIAKTKNGIEITDYNANKYKEGHRFKANEVVFVRIPKAKESNNNPQAGKFIDLGLSQDKKYHKYKYIIQSEGTPLAIKSKLVSQGLAKTKDGVQVTNSKAQIYPDNTKFKAGDTIYIRIPVSNINNGSSKAETPNKPQNKETIEKDVKIIDGMKCKGGEFFGIDVSSYNKRGRKDLEKWNEKSRDNFEKADVRGLSFVYIKAGDGVPNPIPQDHSIKEWLKFVKEHNNKSRAKENHEQIAAGFYWLLSNKTDAKTQADKYVEIYNKHKNQLGIHELIPMLDLETNRFTSEVKKSHKNKKTGKTVIDERYTPKEFCDNALKWLQHVEKKTGIVPGIYTGPVVYAQYIENDRRFDKYRKNMWISAYGGTRINHKEGTVAVGNGKNRHDIKSTMYQSSQNGKIPGVGNNSNQTDMDHTKDITKLFAKNNKSTTETTQNNKSTRETTQNTSNKTKTEQKGGENKSFIKRLFGR